MKGRLPRLQGATPTVSEKRAEASRRRRWRAGCEARRWERCQQRGAGFWGRLLEQGELVEGRKRSCWLLGSLTECAWISSAGLKALEIPLRGLWVAAGANPLGWATVARCDEEPEIQGGRFRLASCSCESQGLGLLNLSAACSRGTWRGLGARSCCRRRRAPSPGTPRAAGLGGGWESLLKSL